jgi:hypothetical protein
LLSLLEYSTIYIYLHLNKVFSDCLSLYLLVCA